MQTNKINNVNDNDKNNIIYYTCLELQFFMNPIISI